VNERRERSGGERLGVATLKWWGCPRPAPQFQARHGLDGAIVAAWPMLRGLASTLGLGFVEQAETGDPHADLVRRLDECADLLEGGATFVWIHLKALDEAGHTKDPHARVGVIESLDPALDRLGAPPFARAVVCVTGDHATPASPEMIHSGDPVPLVVAGPDVRADRVQRFGELDCGEGILGRLRGDDLMPVLLNAADRALFAGSRPTATPGASGHPSFPEPLVV
jgi:2,3-bisphosphoglycerate-independent phosphoglycerate mutase